MVAIRNCVEGPFDWLSNKVPELLWHFPQNNTQRPSPMCFGRFLLSTHSMGRDSQLGIPTKCIVSLAGAKAIAKGTAKTTATASSSSSSSSSWSSSSSSIIIHKTPFYPHLIFPSYIFIYIYLQVPVAWHLCWRSCHRPTPKFSPHGVASAQSAPQMRPFPNVSVQQVGPSYPNSHVPGTDRHHQVDRHKTKIQNTGRVPPDTHRSKKSATGHLITLAT